MANIPLKTIVFPGLDDTYTVPQIDDALTTAGKAADAKKTGDEISQIKANLAPLGLAVKTYTYTASSGYQNIPITFTAGTYLATCHDSGATITFRDSNNTAVSGINIPQTANNYTLTISESAASSIAYIRMYGGSVDIQSTENIVTRVDDLENGLESKADVSALSGKLDKIKEFQPIQISVQSGYISKTGSTYQAGQHFTVNVSDTYARYKVSGQHVNATYPLVCEFDANNNVVSSYSGTAGAVSDYIFTPNSNTAYFNVNAYNGNGACSGEKYIELDDYVDSGIESANAYTDSKTSFDTYNLRQDREARYEIDKRNPFAWKPFDKAYFSWMNDDGRTDMNLYKDLCDTYNIPYANAVPWTVIENNSVIVNGTDIVNYCKQIIEDGGEIFVHAGAPLTSESTEADVLEFCRDGKKIMEDAIETTIYGIIEAGGSGYSTFSKTTGQKFCLAYYAFSDDYGTTPQYKLARTRIMRSSYASDEAQVDAFKAVVDDAIANNKWIRFYCHGTDEVSIAVLTSVFDYIATKVSNGDCAWTTWKNMYDTFRSSQLENRISALE